MIWSAGSFLVPPSEGQRIHVQRKGVQVIRCGQIRECEQTQPVCVKRKWGGPFDRIDGGLQKLSDSVPILHLPFFFIVQDRDERYRDG